jgi:hypothetical protein
MNPFHFITYRAAQDLDASLSARSVGHVPQRGEKRTRMIGPGRAQVPTRIDALRFFTGLVR